MFTAIYFILYLLAAICFLAATVGATLQRINLMALGLLFWVLVPFIGTIRTLG